MPLRPCLELGCPELVHRGRCAGHARARKAVRFVYSSPRWVATRARALRRAGHRCQALERHGRCPLRSGLQGHHDWPGGVAAMIAAGADPFDDRHVVILCDRHHRQAETYLRAQQAASRR